jgi:pyruvate formate lyase activating enzyme
MRNLPQIYGFNKASEMGNNIFTPAIFLSGCNLRCPYCMNARLVKNEVEPIDLNVAKQFVMDNECEWLNISGGEPSLTSLNQLVALFREISSWGCKIGMSTNGMNPYILSIIIPYLKYVALDIKSPNASDYEDICYSNECNGLDRVKSSYKILIENEKWCEFEVRTTLYPSFINKESLTKMKDIIGKDDRWVLQQFRHSKNMLDSEAFNVPPYHEEEIKELEKIAKGFCSNVQLRYV